MLPNDEAAPAEEGTTPVPSSAPTAVDMRRGSLLDLSFLNTDPFCPTARTRASPGGCLTRGARWQPTTGNELGHPVAPARCRPFPVTRPLVVSTRRERSVTPRLPPQPHLRHGGALDALAE